MYNLKNTMYILRNFKPHNTLQNYKQLKKRFMSNNLQTLNCNIKDDYNYYNHTSYHTNLEYEEEVYDDIYNTNEKYEENENIIVYNKEQKYFYEIKKPYLRELLNKNQNNAINSGTPCYHCKGSGWINNNNKKLTNLNINYDLCHVCNGTGII